MPRPPISLRFVNFGILGSPREWYELVSRVWVMPSTLQAASLLEPRSRGQSRRNTAVPRHLRLVYNSRAAHAIALPSERAQTPAKLGSTHSRLTAEDVDPNIADQQEGPRVARSHPSVTARAATTGECAAAPAARAAADREHN